MHSISNTVERKFVDSIDLQHLEIETDSGWQPISKIMKTVPYQVWTIQTESGKTLDCADDHIVFTAANEEIFVKDLIPGDFIKGLNGNHKITLVTHSDREENMFDISVDSADHRYYTNGILSHNTTIINALSYALYGNALSNIKKDNLINLTNGKNMVVTVEFEKDNVGYRIERGRKPTFMRFWVGDLEQELTNDAQGDSRETQQEIERMIGMSHDMFKHIVALNTYTEPFLSLKANDQRTIIEQLLGVTLLSEKADALKELVRATKDSIQSEEYRIKAVGDANKRIEEQITNLVKRQTQWLTKHTDDVSKLAEALVGLKEINIDVEIAAHKSLKDYKTRSDDILQIKNQITREQNQLTKDEIAVAKLKKEIQSLIDHTCHACGQEIHDDTHTRLLEQKNTALLDTETEVATVKSQLTEYKEALLAMGKLGDKPSTFYPKEEDAIHHRSTLASLEQQIATLSEAVDPYAEQILDMQEAAIEKISYDHINGLGTLKDHQEFLQKLLTNKDSFIRKRIIDQNLSYLNARLGYYLDKMGLPHSVKFQSDLTVDIHELGRELSFDNLSRGERTRLILSLSWAFRDVWEASWQPINLLFVDELVDSGLDSSGVENALAILKKMARDQNKSVWLVSHKDELMGRVNNILSVVKENGFSSFSSGVEIS